jgi:phage terminase large subunit
MKESVYDKEEYQEKIKLLGREDNAQILERDHTKQVVTDNGSAIYFKGIKTSSGNNTAALKSLANVSIWILDEAEELINEAEYDKISLSIRTKHPRNLRILILNPTHKKHFIYKKFFLKKQVPAGFCGIKDNVLYIHTTYLDNKKNLPDNILLDYERMKVEDPAKYEHVVMGGWLDQKAGLIFDNIESLQNRPTKLQFLGVGMDYGFSSDPTAIVLVYRNLAERETIFVETVCYETGLFNKDIAARLKALRLRGKYIVADSAEAKTNADLQSNYGLPVVGVKKGAGSIMAGINKLKNYKIQVLENDILAAEFYEYAWHNEKPNEPAENQQDHAIDGLRYFCMQML